MQLRIVCSFWKWINKLVASFIICEVFESGCELVTSIQLLSQVTNRSRSTHALDRR